MNARLWIAIVFGFGAAAPATGQTPASGCPTVVSEPVMRAQPGDVSPRPGVVAIRDSLYTVLRSAAREAGVAQPVGIVFAQMRDRRDDAVRVWSYRSNVPDAVSQAVISRHTRLLACWPEREVFVNLRLDSLPAADGFAMRRMPVLLNPQEFADDLQRISSRRSSDPLNRTRLVTLNVRMLITRDGEVAHAEVTRRTTNADMERAVLDAVRRMRFRPAVRRSGEPADVWVEQPIQVQVAG
jgi:TonB family protein